MRSKELAGKFERSDLQRPSSWISHSAVIVGHVTGVCGATSC